MEKMFALLKELYATTDEKSFQKLFERIEKYEDMSDKMEGEIARYLGDVGSSHLSDETKGKIRSMLRQIGELESIGDSFFCIARILRRGRDNKVEYTEEQTEGGREMYKLVEDALHQMNFALANRKEDVQLSDSVEIEKRINECRNLWRARNVENVDNHIYGYSSGSVFTDLINECEKTGDYIMNVVEARLGVVRNGIRFKGIQIDTDNKLVSVGNTTVSLTRTEYELLKLLVSTPGKAYSKEELLKAVWPDDAAASERLVDLTVARLRRKIGQYSSSLTFKEGSGYLVQE